MTYAAGALAAVAGAGFGACTDAATTSAARTRTAFMIVLRFLRLPSRPPATLKEWRRSGFPG